MLSKNTMVKARIALEKLYNGTCDVIIYEKIKNLVTKQTNFEEKKIIENQPCKLSHGSSPVTSDGSIAGVSQEIVLFISPDIVIPEGCKIIVTQNDRTTEYANSGKPKVYSTHQEIVLKLFERWA